MDKKKCPKPSQQAFTPPPLTHAKTDNAQMTEHFL